MKKNWCKKIVSIFLLIVTVNIQAHQQPNYTDMLVNKTVTAWMNQNQIPGVAIELYENGQSHSYYFGYANREKKIPITSKTIFELGSLTKLFTTLLLAEEVNANKITLNDPVSKYLPKLNSNRNFRNITLEKLSTYTSGLPFKTPENITTQSELQQFLTSWNPSSPIGSSWAYSNISIGLLGYALEEKTGKNIDELYRTQIFHPLHMESTSIYISKDMQPNYAQGYGDDGKAVSPSKIGLFPAAGDMKSSGKDMLQFLQVAITLADTPKTIVKAMHITQTAYVNIAQTKQGLSWVIYPLADHSKSKLLAPPKNMDMGPIPAKQLDKPTFEENSLIDKTGATEGFRSYIAVIPNKQLGVVILANRYVSNGEIIKVGREILLKN